MNSQIIAIGEPEIIKKIIDKKMYAEDKNTFVINVEIYDQSRIITELQNNGIEVCHKSKLDSLLKTNNIFQNFESYNKETIYDWLKKGIEYFGILESKEFSLFSTENLNPEIVCKLNMVEFIRFSNNGAIIACLIKGIVNFYVNNLENKLVELKPEEGIIKDVIFHNSDRYVAIITNKNIIIYHLLKGKIIFKSNNSEFYFINDGFYHDIYKYKINEDKNNEINICKDNTIIINKSNKNLNDLLKKKIITFFNDFEFKSFIKVHENKIVEYSYDNIPKITYKNGDKIQSKMTNLIIKDNIYFSKSNMYILTYKILQKKILYDIESFTDSLISVNNLESSVLSISVSDKYFVIYDNACNLKFYLKNKYSFYVLKEFKKEGSGIVSTMNGMTCFYNGFTSNLEFYDIISVNNKMDVKLKCVYLHPGCTNLKWSESGLYLSAYSFVSSNSLLQIFNANGKLIYKKTHAGLTSFEWRKFKKLNDVEKVNIGSIPEDFCQEELKETEKDISILLSDWKAYLLSKLIKNKDKISNEIICAKK